MMLFNQTLQHFLTGYLFACLQPLSRGQIPCSSSLVLWNLFQFSSHKKHLIIIQMMIKGQQWMRKRAGRWLLEGGGKRDECFPLHLIAQESKRAQNQIQLQSRRKSDKRQERLGTKMHDNSAQTQKLRNLITLEEFFPRKFFQNNSRSEEHTSELQSPC